MIYDKASLVHIPSGVKSGTLYNVVPNNADGDFDFTRGSTATRVNKDGLIETVDADVPRLNYPLIDGVVSGCPSLLLEPQRTNLIPYSEQVNSMSLNSVSVVTDNTISPNGTLDADKLTPIGSGFKTVGNFLSVSAGSSYTISFFYKNIDHKNIGFYDNNTPNSEIQINLEDNSFILGSAITDGGIDYYGNGWYRAYATFVANNSTMANYLIFRSDTNNGNYTADGSSIYAWGFQVELSSYKTSYIPSLIGSQTTRSADICNGAGTANDFNDSEGVLYANIAALADDLTFRHISISDGTNSNIVQLRYRSTSNVLQALLYVGGVGEVYGVTLNDITTSSKAALKYKENDVAFWVDGFERVIDTSASTFPDGTLDTLRFQRGEGTYDFYGKTKELMTFKEALSDIELETLTSYKSFNEMATEQLYTIK